ncbi:rho GDP-dissociation inhibitor [Mycena olivaceomarginata]|nr:rho GDP-dissociation inhibitor [Mycena olivaceomarginata]
MSHVEDDHHDEHDDHDVDLTPSTTPGYKPAGPVKSADEYAKLDAEDESLARWKASLGIVPGAGGPATGPKVTVLTLEHIEFRVDDAARLEEIRKTPIVIKEGIKYKSSTTLFISGVRYIQAVSRVVTKSTKIPVDKLDQMLGSYGPHPKGEAYSKTFPEETSPSGMLARSGTYVVKSRVVDDDGEVYAEWAWSFKLAKEW